MKALTLALISSVLVAVLLPTAPAAAVSPTAAEKKVVVLLNKERAKRGLGPVKLNAALTRAARAHSRQMARRGVLTHLSANRDTVAERLIRHGFRRAGYRSWSAGENIARARLGTLFATPAGVVRLWMGSQSHRRVILRPGFLSVGVGVAKSSCGQRYFTLDLGRRVR